MAAATWSLPGAYTRAELDGPYGALGVRLPDIAGLGVREGVRDDLLGRRTREAVHHFCSAYGPAGRGARAVLRPPGGCITSSGHLRAATAS
ncbi:hypothetical protein GT044_38680 [Streptomyces sp. SID335]|nr:hypothetical protein [Streptomyces sp. SID335]MYZ12409.1 hypothetical protein [Streptomyces sp. SID337]NDZ89468.1 hypothetical protein [Streptomyces sp. SID10115]NEA05086.1 hypothetical protein [Streptomyces sp. SID10116]NEB47780.1 hypothetical protein [Streptomyces sp. SID339]